MKKNEVIGLVDFYNAPELGELTENRSLGSTSFLGRYAFCDFALSNFTNSDIPTVGLLIKKHQRSVMKHLGSMSSWITNTKVGSQRILVNENGVLNPLTNTDVANIRENDWVLYDSNASYIVFQSAHIVANVDIRPILKEHIARHEKITSVYTKIKDASQEFERGTLVRVDGDGYITSVKQNDHLKEEALASMEIWIINRTVLAEIIQRRAVWNERAGMQEILKELLYDGSYKVHGHEWKGDYVRSFDSFDHYIRYCTELLNPEVAAKLFDPEWPHYTLTHDTPPALYGEDSKVVNSFIANGAVVEGTVENSILSRDVRVAKGATVKNCIIFSNVKIAEGAHLENCLIDKYSIIQRDVDFHGDPMKYAYLKQGTIL